MVMVYYCLFSFNVNSLQFFFLFYLRKVKHFYFPNILIIFPIPLKKLVHRHGYRDGYTAVRPPDHGNGTFLTTKRMEYFDVSSRTMLGLFKPFDKNVKPVLVFNDGVFFRDLMQNNSTYLYHQLTKFANTILDFQHKVGRCRSIKSI